MKRFVGMDIHKKFIMAAVVSQDMEILLKPRKIPIKEIKDWVERNLTCEDEITMEATSNCWEIYDQLVGGVAAVRIANAHKLKIISASIVKTDRHDSLVLARILGSGLLPEVWVPPQHIRDLRYLTAHRKHLVRKRTAAKNRLQGVIIRHNIMTPGGNLYGPTQRTWWFGLELSDIECLIVKQELAHIDYLGQAIAESEAMIAEKSITKEWHDQVAYILQIPGIGLNSAMTILAAIGEISRFPTAENLSSYAGLVSRVHSSGNSYHTGGISRQGRKELRSTLIECAWIAVAHSSFWKEKYETLMKRTGKNKAITAIARKILVVIWHTLSKQEADWSADLEIVARSMMTWAIEVRSWSNLHVKRSEFVRNELDRLHIGYDLTSFRYGSKVLTLPPSNFNICT